MSQPSISGHKCPVCGYLFSGSIGETHLCKNPKDTAFDAVKVAEHFHDGRDVGEIPGLVAAARYQFEQDQKVISELRSGSDIIEQTLINATNGWHDKVIKLQAELAIAKEQLAWNLQNNDEFGCEYVGIVLLKKDLAKVNARFKDCIEVLKDCNEWFQDRIGYEEGEPMDFTHQEVVRVLATDDKALADYLGESEG